jgi:hypothetical protein
MQKLVEPVKDFVRRMVQSEDGCNNWYDLSFKGSYEMYKECDGNPLVTYRSDKKYEDLTQIFRNDIPYRYESICSKRSRNNLFCAHTTSRDALTFLLIIP